MEMLVQAFGLLIVSVIMLFLFYAPIVFGIVKLVQLIKEKQKSLKRDKDKRRKNMKEGHIFKRLIRHTIKGSLIKGRLVSI
jgi:large-conductance mechanosensitive channel